MFFVYNNGAADKIINLDHVIRMNYYPASNRLDIMTIELARNFLNRTHLKEEDVVDDETFDKFNEPNHEVIELYCTPDRWKQLVDFIKTSEKYFSFNNNYRYFDNSHLDFDNDLYFGPKDIQIIKHFFNKKIDKIEIMPNKNSTQDIEIKYYSGEIVLTVGDVESIEYKTSIKISKIKDDTYILYGYCSSENLDKEIINKIKNDYKLFCDKMRKDKNHSLPWFVRNDEYYQNAYDVLEMEKEK